MAAMTTRRRPRRWLRIQPPRRAGGRRKLLSPTGHEYHGRRSSLSGRRLTCPGAPGPPWNQALGNVGGAHELHEKSGEPSGIRTLDPLIKSEAGDLRTAMQNNVSARHSG